MIIPFYLARNHLSTNGPMALTIPSNYGLVLIPVASIGLVQLVIGGGAMKHRAVFSSPEYLAKKEVKELLEEHKKHTGEAMINKTGYPDMGNGRYAAHLSYGQWLDFNNAQRAHYNMIEGSGPVLASILGNNPRLD
jgi:hypothetical protein